jgi:hypothetical protein
MTGFGPARIDPVRDRVLAAGNLISALTLGAGVRFEGERIVSDKGFKGHIAFGPYWPMQTGDYVVSFQIKAAARWRERNTPVLALEVVENDVFFAQRDVLGRQAENGVFDVPFRIDAPPKGRPVEFRIWSFGLVAAEISRVTVRRAG